MQKIDTKYKSKLTSKASVAASQLQKCPICKSAKIEIMCESPRIARCLECHHGYRCNSDKDIERSYSGRVLMPSHFEARLFANHHYNFVSRNLGFENISSILEIGSGDGTLLRLIRKRNPNIELYSVEPSKELCKNLLSIPEIHVFNTYIEDTEFKRRFDLVIMSHVLEHLKDPVGIIRFIHDKILTDSGHLYIDIPNQDFELGNPRMASMAPLTHLHFFDGKYFHNILKRAGFHIDKIKGSKYATIPASYVNRVEIISNLRNSGRLVDKVKLYHTKVLNKASLIISSTSKSILGYRPKEMNLNQNDSRYNNQAIIAGK